VIVLLLVWAIYQQVFAKQNAAELLDALIVNFQGDNLIWLILVALLVPVNWGFETLKWQQLIKNFAKLNFWQTYRAILAGITVSLVTPNRIGEYGGRILMVKAKHNWKAVIATLVGSLSQLLMLLSFGLLGLIYFAAHFLEVDQSVLYGAFFFGGLAVLFMLIAFLNIDLFVAIAKRIPIAQRFRKYLKHVKVLKKYTTRELLTALLYAALRYSVYTFQYYLMLRFFGIDVPVLAAFSGIATIYLLQTSIPLPPIVGLAARGEIALYIWGFFSDETINVLAASYTLFLINLSIPALLGALFIVQTNVMKSLGYENDKTNS